MKDPTLHPPRRKEASAFLFVLFLAALPLTTVRAQDPLPVTVGDRVRVTHGCVFDTRSRLECKQDDGTLQAIDGDTLTVDSLRVRYGQ